MSKGITEAYNNSPTLRWAWNKWQTFDIDTLKEPLFAARDFLLTHYSNYVNAVKSWSEYANTFPQTKYIIAHAKRVYYRVGIDVKLGQLLLVPLSMPPTSKSELTNYA